MNLQPTFTGYVASTEDALLLFQATINGKLPAVSRRPHDRERTELVKSGAVFVFNEQTSGIKRWTDGIAWSPSRILGNFLVYRQLEKPFTPGEKKQTNKRNSTSSSSSKRNSIVKSPYSGRRESTTDFPPLVAGGEEDTKYPVGATGSVAGSVTGSSLPIQISLPNQSSTEGGAGDIPAERSLVGSLVDSYGFKKDGLIKKTMSISVDGQPHHLVSYYKPEDVISNVFETPRDNAFLKDIQISEELSRNQNFRIPLENSTEPGRNNSATRTHPQMHNPPPPAHMGYMTAGHQAAPPPHGYEIPSYEMDMSVKSNPSQTFFRNPPQQPQQPINAQYFNYRGYPPPQQQPFLQQEYFSNNMTPHPTQAPQPPFNNSRLPATTGANNFSPSLPPLTQGYSYQTFGGAGGNAGPDQNGSSAGHVAESDPRRLPDSTAGANSANANNQGYSPRPLMDQQQQQQPVGAPGYGYNYPYSHTSQW